MRADFSFDVDPIRNLMRIWMAGFFSAGDIENFVFSLEQAHLALRCGPNDHLTLVDIRDMDIQSQDSVATFQAVLSNPQTASRRIAFVVARSLARMQIRRAAESRDAAYFGDRDEAERWLLSKDSSPS